jgi:hypothetical protein
MALEKLLITGASGVIGKVLVLKPLYRLNKKASTPLRDNRKSRWL